MGLLKSDNVPPSAAAFSMRDVEDAARRVLVRAQQRAEQLLAAAQQEAAAMQVQAKARGFAEGKAEGIAAGTEEGRAAGRAAAFDEAKQQLGDCVTALSAAMVDFDANRQPLDAAALRDVVGLASSIARRVTKRQGVLDPESAIANLDEAMKLVTATHDVRVAIHPLQAATLGEAMPKLQLAWPALAHAVIVEDATVGPGGCRVYTRHGELDASIDAQLDRVIAELLPTP